MAFKRTFSAEQLKLNGLLLTGSSDGLFYDGVVVGATEALNVGGKLGEIYSGKKDQELLLKTIHGGANITITNGDNFITIASNIPTDTATQLTALNTASGYLHSSVQLVSGDLDVTEAAISVLETATGYIDSEVVAISGSVQSISGDVVTIGGDINTINSDITVLEIATGDIKVDLGYLETASGYLHNTLIGVSDHVDVHHGEVAVIEDLLLSTTGSLGLVSGHVDAHHTEISTNASNLATTGTTLHGYINTLSGESVLLHGVQTAKGNKYFEDTVYVQNLVVQGTTSTFSTEAIAVGGTFLNLNTGTGMASGVQTQFAGLDISRQTGSGQFLYPHALIVWNEGAFEAGIATSSDGKSYEPGIKQKGWQIGITGTGHGNVLYDIATTDLTDGLNVNIGLLSGELVKTGVSIDGRIEALEDSHPVTVADIATLAAATGHLHSDQHVLSQATGVLITSVQVVSGIANSAVPQTTSVFAGLGLDGGGALGGDLTLNVGVGSGLYATSNILNISGLGVTNNMLAGSIADTKLNKITTSKKVGGQSIDISSAIDGASITLNNDDTLLVGDNGTTKKVKISQLTDGLITGKADSSTVGVVTLNSTHFSDNGVGLISADAITVHADAGLTGSTSVNLGGTLKLGANVDGSTISVDGDALRVQPGGIGNLQLGVNYAGSPSKGGDANATVGALSPAPGQPGVMPFTFDGSADTDFAVDDTVVRTFGFQEINGNKMFHGDVMISNLNVTGSFTRIDVNNVTIEDNLILLNSGEAGAGVTMRTAGIQIDRGSQADAYILFDEAAGSRDTTLDKKWVLGITGAPHGIHALITEREFETKKVNIPNSADVVGVTYDNVYGAIPNVVASISNTGHLEDFLGHQVSGMSTTGCWIQLTDQVTSQNYQATVFVSLV
jgi:hypothetical protein